MVKRERSEAPTIYLPFSQIIPQAGGHEMLRTTHVEFIKSRGKIKILEKYLQLACFFGRSHYYPHL